MMDWFAVPPVFPEIEVWGCIREPWQYCLSHNHERDDWAATAQPVGTPVHTWSIGPPVPVPRTELGWNFPTREAAIAAIEQHYRDTRQ